MVKMFNDSQTEVACYILINVCFPLLQKKNFYDNDTLPKVCTRITCVKIVNSVEYMVAAGSVNGQVSVFQIQKELPPDLDLVAPCTRSKPIERYTIRDLHRCVVSCCEWSKNGMKLYSGDRQGIVVLTEFDYQTVSD